MRARPSSGSGSHPRAAHIAPPKMTGSLFILALMAVLAVVAGFAALIAAVFPALAA